MPRKAIPEETPAPVRILATIEARHEEGPRADPSAYPKHLIEYLDGTVLEVWDLGSEAPAYVRLRVVSAEVAPADDEAVSADAEQARGDADPAAG
jgi:hypothetical protein